jgi:hypothetical protein
MTIAYAEDDYDDDCGHYENVCDTFDGAARQCGGVRQCAAECSSVRQSAAVCGSVRQRAAVCGSVR